MNVAVSLKATTRRASARIRRQRARKSFEVDREIRNQDRRDRKIQKLLSENPIKAVGPIVYNIIEEAKKEAGNGNSFYCWCPSGLMNRSLWKILKSAVVDALRARGLKAKVDCGHGHGTKNYINCDGTFYTSCWVECIISW